jgi:hypothetical protein
VKLPDEWTLSWIVFWLLMGLAIWGTIYDTPWSQILH